MRIKVSFYKRMGIPDAIGVAIFLIVFGFAIAPYLSGKVGPISIPDLDDSTVENLRYLGPLAVLFSLLPFLPIWNLLGTDRQLGEFYRKVFDRPAFKVSFANEVAKEDFMDAITDTGRALTTGVLVDRITKNELLKVEIDSKQLSPKLLLRREVILKNLHEIRAIYAAALSKEKVRFFEHNGAYYSPEMDTDTANLIDGLVIGTIQEVNYILKTLGVSRLPVALNRDKHSD